MTSTTTARAPRVEASADDALAGIRANVEWGLKVSDRLTAMDAPTKEELYILRLYDPFRQFLRCSAA